MKTVLVTGGAGSLGREVALSLADRGCRVRVCDLPQCDYAPLEGIEAIDICKGSVNDAASLRHAVRDIDAAIHLAALLPPLSERDREMTMRVNVGGTRCLSEALLAENPETHLILASSVCVYGDTGDVQEPLSVSRAPAPLDVYGESKAAAEAHVRDSGLPYTCLRISGIAVPAFLAPPDVWPFRSDQRIEYVCRPDVVAALVACIDNPQAVGKTYNIAGGASWRLHGSEYVARYNEVMGLEADDARYLDRYGTFDWYDTEVSQAVLGYQCTSFEAFLGQLTRAIEAALGDGDAV